MTALPTITVVDAVLGCMAALSPVHELSGNRGYFPDAINRWAGSPLGSAWCLNAVHYAGAMALGRKRWPLPINGDCDVLLPFARKAGILHDTPARGAIFLKIDPTNPDNATHAGLVDEPFAGGRFSTREGNSNETGSREGMDGHRGNRAAARGGRALCVRLLVGAIAPVIRSHLPRRSAAHATPACRISDRSGVRDGHDTMRTSWSRARRR